MTLQDELTEVLDDIQDPFIADLVERAIEALTELENDVQVMSHEVTVLEDEIQALAEDAAGASI